MLHTIKRHRFFVKAISKLMYKKLKNKVKDKFLSENAPGDNFPASGWILLKK